MLITYIIFYIENIISIIILHLNFDIFNYAKYKEFIFKYSSFVLPFSVQNQNLILSSIGGSNYIANREKNNFTLALPLLRRVKHKYTLPLLCRVQQTNSLVKNYSSINYKVDPIVTKLKDTSLLTIHSKKLVIFTRYKIYARLP